MPIRLTEKQNLLLRISAATVVVYLAFRYLMPLVLPFLIAGILSLLIRPAAALLNSKLRLPMGVSAALVLTAVLAAVAAVIFILGRVTAEQLLRLWEHLPEIWEQICRWAWDCCKEVEESLHLERGSLSRQMPRFMQKETFANSSGEDPVEMGQLAAVLATSFQGAVTVLKMGISALVTLFVTVGATFVTTTQLEGLKKSLDRSPFRREIRRVLSILTQVGSAYGKTQLVIMVCTVAVSAVGLTLLGDPYALLWAAVIGLVDALPLFGAGTILWPWILLSVLRGQLARTMGLSAIYAISNLLRQWLEAHYMGDKIGLSALENLIAMYLGLQLFGVLGLFLGPMGYLLIKESSSGSFD